MRTKTAKSKAQAIREFVEKNPSAAMRSVAEKFDTSYPYTCMIIKEMYKKAAPAKMVPAEVEDEEGKFTAEIPVPVNALNVQVSGDHYKHMKIQPVEFITANRLSFLEGCIVKRISRWRSKDGLKDLEKIKHEVDLLIELEGLK
jgi:hypothetical protein